MATLILAGILSAVVSNYLELFISRIIVGILIWMDYAIIFSYICDLERGDLFKSASMVTIIFWHTLEYCFPMWSDGFYLSKG